MTRPGSSALAALQVRVSPKRHRLRAWLLVPALMAVLVALGLPAYVHAAAVPRPLWATRVDAPTTAPAATASLSLGLAGAHLVDEAAPPPDPPSAAAAGQPRETDAELTEPRLLRKRSVPPFWINREYDTHHTRAVAFPPLFIHRTPKKDHPEKLLHADLSLTFGWYSKRVQRRRWINPAALFFGSFSQRKTVWGAVPLLMGYRRVGEQFNFGQFPLVWWWGTKFVKNFLVIPFHYQQKSPDGFMGVSAVLFWYGHKYLDDTDLTNDRRHFVAAPVFWRFQRGFKRFDFAFLYIGGHNKLDGLEYRAAVPFFVWRQSEFGNRRELWTLPWIKRVDRARRRSSWAVPLALTFRHDDPDKRVFSATPLFWQTRNKLKGSRFTLAGPVGLYDDPRQRNLFVAPLWYQFHDKQASATTRILAPLAFSRSTPERTSVWTLLGGGVRTKKGWGMGIPPLLTFAGKRDDDTRFQSIGGLLWHVRNPTRGSNRWIAGPLGYYDKHDGRRHLGLPPLLTFAGWGGGRHYQVITPLLWHVRDREAGRRTLVAGPLYHHQTKEGFDGGLAPLAFWGRNAKRRYGIVPWLGFGDVYDPAEQSRLTISPVFVRYKDPKRRTLGVAGLAWDVRRPNEQHTVVFPFLYRRAIEDRATIVTPLGGSYRKADALTAVFGPVYRRKSADRSGWGVLPVLFHDRHEVTGGTSTHTAFVPLYLRRRTPTDDLDMWSPLVWRSRVRGDKPRSGLAVIPLYFRQRQPGGVDLDAGLGWFWSRDRRRRTHTLIIGTGFHRLSRTQLNTGVAPLWWWHDTEKKRRLLALPAIFHFETKGQEHTTVAVPFWFDRKKANGTRGWSAFPFVFGFKRLYNFTRFSLAPPGYVDVFRINRNSRFVGHVPLLFRYQKCGFVEGDEPGCQYTLWGSVPFFLYGKDGKGRRTHGALMLYYWDRRPEGWKLYTPLFGVNNQPGKVLGWYAGPLGVKTTNTHRRSMFLPLYYRKKHRLEDESVTVIAPPLFISRHRKDRRFFEAGLVVWQFRQQHKVSTAILPPIFYHSHSYAQRRLTWVAPLFLRDNNVGKDEAWTAIAPALYVQRRRGQDLDFVQFPLVWHIERGEEQGTFGAFAWWDIRARGRTFQMVPGAYLRFVGRDQRDTKIIGPGLGWWTKDPVADGLHWRALFGVFGGGRENGRKYISIFGARIDRGPAPARTKKSSRAERKRRRALRQAQRRHDRLEARLQRLLDRQARVGSRPILSRRIDRNEAAVEDARSEVAKLSAADQAAR